MGDYVFGNTDASMNEGSEYVGQNIDQFFNEEDEKEVDKVTRTEQLLVNAEKVLG